MAGGSKGIVDGTPESISYSGGRGMNRSWLNRDREAYGGVNQQALDRGVYVHGWS